MDNSFGDQLRAWRRRAGLSQLGLATDAEVSQKHVSFIEAGRSTPSREMVTHLARSLGVPPREQNRMLIAAGHAPVYPESDFDDLDQIRDALEFMVEAHSPYMAVVVDRWWNVLLSNRSAAMFAAMLIDPAALGLAPPFNLMRATFHPEGLRSHMVNWDEAGPILLGLFDQAASRQPSDDAFCAFVDEIHQLAGPLTLSPPQPNRLLVPVTYDIEGREIRLFTTIASIGGANDITVSEILIETFWPADEQSDEAWRALFG